MTVKHFQPAAHLQPFVKRYVIIETADGTTNQLLPDTSLVMAIRFSGTVLLEKNGGLEHFSNISLSGIQHGIRQVHYKPGAGNVLVMFKTGAAAAFFNEPLHELSGNSIPAEFLQQPNELQQLPEQLSAAASHEERITLVEQTLSARLKQEANDPLILHALHQIRLS